MRSLGKVLLAVSFLIFPLEGYVSGSIYIDYGEQSFLLSYDNKRHRTYINDQQATREQEYVSRSFYAGMKQKSADITSLISEYDKKGLSSSDINLIFSMQEISVADDISLIQENRYPLLISKRFTQGDNNPGEYIFRFVVTKPISAKLLDEFYSKLATILFSDIENDEKINLDDYSQIFFVNYFEQYGINISTNFQVENNSKAFFDLQLESLFDHLNQRLSQEVTSARFKDNMGADLENVLELKQAVEHENPQLFSNWAQGIDQLADNLIIRPMLNLPAINIKVIFVTNENNKNNLWAYFPEVIQKNLPVDTDYQ